VERWDVLGNRVIGQGEEEYGEHIHGCREDLDDP
jgi:hypothetical protein